MRGRHAIWIMRFTGMVLLVAALAKLHGLVALPFSTIRVLAAPELQLALINAELLLGAWLLSGKEPLTAWATAIVTFAFFAAASVYLALIGEPSCGCFGILRLNPWLTFCVDTIVLSCLIAYRPDCTPLMRQPRRTLQATALRFTGPAVALAGIWLLVVLIAGYAFGSTRQALAYARGDRLSLIPSVIDAEVAPPNTIAKFTVAIHNWTDQAVTILGGTNDCACCTVTDLPVNVPPRSSVQISLDFAFPPKPFSFRRKVDLITNDPQVSVLSFTVVGTCVEKTNGAALEN